MRAGLVDELTVEISELTLSQWDAVGALYGSMDVLRFPRRLAACQRAESAFWAVKETPEDIEEVVKLLSYQALGTTLATDLKTPNRQCALTYVRTLVLHMANSCSPLLYLEHHASLLRLALGVPSEWLAEFPALVAELGADRALEAIELVDR